MTAVITPADPASLRAAAVSRPETRQLMLGEGFRHIPPFGPYRDDPVSRCYEKRIE